MERLDIEKMIDERLAHKESVNKSVISGLFYDFKEVVLVQFAKITEKIETLIEERRKTNGRIEKLEAKITQLELVDATIIEQLKGMEKVEKKEWDIKTIIIGTLFGAGITLLMKFLIK